MKKALTQLLIKRATFIFSAIAILGYNSVNAQFGLLFEGGYGSNEQQIGIGIATLHQANLPQPLLGIDIKYRTKSQDIYIKSQKKNTFFCVNTSYFFKQEKLRNDFFKATTSDTSLISSIDVPYDITETVSYFTLELGKDFYLLTSKKETFGVYAGFICGFFLPIYRGYYRISEYDKVNYVLNVEEDWKPIKKTTTANFKLGINLGTEVNVGAFGSLYLEATPFVKLFAEKDVKKEISLPSRFFLGFNLGYRYAF